jgi:hypothetical protein
METFMGRLIVYIYEFGQVCIGNSRENFQKYLRTNRVEFCSNLEDQKVALYVKVKTKI